jgi:1-pyrroline-5-carboxylate dehydrogenase
MDAITAPPPPENEPVLDYAPGSQERRALVEALMTFRGVRELPAVIGGRSVMPRGESFSIVTPHRHERSLGRSAHSTAAEASAAIDAASRAAAEWRELSFDDRAAVFLKAADLLSGPWRARLNAATMLGQAKTVYQAEIDAACELADFWRFNVSFAREILSDQPPAHAHGVWNRTDHRPLEGFVYAITPFNFTSIAGNLPTAPALMGNTVLWKPAVPQLLAASVTMELLSEAGLPNGVINLLPGDGLAVSQVALTDSRLAGIHFTGSTATFQSLWQEVGRNLPSYRGYPRLVGETGGKDFLVAHPSADLDVLRTAVVRGAFEYSGQKCSAASRVYVPRSVWTKLREPLVAETEELRVGDVEDFTSFTSAVIDRRAFDKHVAAIQRARTKPGITVAAGGTADDSVGYFVRPTVLVGEDPMDEIFSTEYFGPIVSVFVFDDAQFDDVLRLVDRASPYALTGAVIASDRSAIARAAESLRFAAGNFYINDKPTGAVVGQQPFGGSRASGTNDKAGSALNLLRWTSPRSIKETTVPPRSIRYPHQG